MDAAAMHAQPHKNESRGDKKKKYRSTNQKRKNVTPNDSLTVGSETEEKGEGQ